MLTLAQMAVLFLACVVLFSIEWENPWSRLSPTNRTIILGLNASSIMFLAYQVSRTLRNPGEWDFLAFYLWGRLVGSGLPVYEPESSRLVLSAIEIPITPSTAFMEEVVHAGPNNPPTALLWCRLLISDMGFETAHIVWMSVTLAFFVICCFLLARSLRGQFPTLTMLLIPVLALSPVTSLILRLGQTTFLVMAFVLAAWLTLRRVDSAVWLVLGSLLKPFVALLGLYLVLRRRWVAVLSAIGIGTASLVASGLLIGFDAVSDFLRGGLVARAPKWLFTESVNESLMAVVLRWLDPEVAGGNTLTHPVFLLLALILVIVTSILGWFASNAQNRLVFLLVLCLALLIYPGTLKQYGFFLFLPWLYISGWMKNEGFHPVLLSIGLWGGIGLISYCTFAANLATWGTLVFLISTNSVRAKPAKEGL